MFRRMLRTCFTNPIQAVALLAYFVGIAGSPATVWAEGGTIKFVPHAGLRALDPVWSGAYIVRNHGFMIYDQLFGLDAEFRPRPKMVDKWCRSASGLSYGWYCDPKLTELQGRWSQAADAARAKTLAEEIQREAYVSGAYVPLGQFQQPGAFRDITGVVPAPVPVFWNLRKG